MSNIPELVGRDRIMDFAAEEAERLGHAVLLLPVPELTLDVPERMPPGRRIKDRVGREMEPNATAYLPDTGFDAAALTGIYMTQGLRTVGVHMTQYTGGYETDLMAINPGAVRGQGNLLIVDGLGWVGRDSDPQLGPDARYVNTLGSATLLGHGIVDLGDLSVGIRQVSDPSMEHYQAPQPIGV